MRFLLLLAVIAVVVWLVRRYIVARSQSRQITDDSGPNAERLTDDGEDTWRDDAERIDCPRCAERIRRQAKVCRYCGHELTQ